VQVIDLFPTVCSWLILLAVQIFVSSELTISPTVIYLSSDLCFVCCVSFLPFRGIILGTLSLVGLGILHSGSSLCLAVILGQWLNISKEI
jgi:hypothetical protein